MNAIDRNSIAKIQFRLDWQSPECRHLDCYFASSVNFWRDCFIPDHFKKLQGAEPGEIVVLHNSSESPYYSYQPELVHHIRPGQFDNHTPDGRPITPKPGRFYPRGFVQGIPGIFPQNIKLCRCTAVNGEKIEIDLNQPMAGRRIAISAEIISISASGMERGGRCEDWLETITDNGPGVQARLFGSPPLYSGMEAWQRDDERDDGQFYKKPRFVQHIDDTARQVIRDLYTSRLQSGAEVLDLMASWDSHLPKTAEIEKIVALGLNREELEANNTADEIVVQDLNTNPELPFQDGSFDAVICTVSVEYLTRPVEVFAEIARVLRPAGIAIITFSNRWFDPKVVHIWRDLHEFERLALVTSYFLETERFKDVETFSLRGLPRPEDDRYAWQLPFSDPVYLVAGRRV